MEQFDICNGKTKCIFGDYKTDFFDADKNCEKVLVLTDANVNKIYGKEFCTALEGKKTFKKVLLFEILPGEKSKSVENLLAILSFLEENSFTKNDLLISLGGGVVSDLGGLAAGLYKRGMPHIIYPTTLLSMVDASVGGKTAVNSEFNKNIYGIINFPKVVFFDVEFLQTLPERELRNGLAEVVKTAILNKNLAEKLISVQFPFDENICEEIVKTCVLTKSEIVEKDENDLNLRHLLNLGHTLGHAFEAASNFEIMHGEAVALGLSIMAKNSPDKDKIYEMQGKFGLPLAKNNISKEFCEKALAFAFEDKKALSGEKISIVKIFGLGDCRICDVSFEELREIAYDGLL